MTLLSIRVQNCFVFSRDAEFSMRADLRQKKFMQNVLCDGQVHALKSAVILGANNAGKTKLIQCVRAFKQVMLNQKVDLVPNLFSKDTVCRLQVTFSEHESEYSFEVQYDAARAEFIYERFARIIYDQYKNKKEENWLIKDTVNQQYVCADDVVQVAMKTTAKNNIMIYLLDTAQFPLLSEIKRLIVAFAPSIDIVDMNNIPIKKTIDLLKSSGAMRQKITHFILNADLSLDDFRYAADEEVQITHGSDNQKAQEEVLNIPADVVEMLHLVSVYKGVPVPSMVFDSTGTKKMAALASYVIDALENNRILFIDELDNSLHFRLTRAIVAMFNNELNSGAQLICTAHDVSLLDCKKLLRKEQIWFAHKDTEAAVLYSLAAFTAGRDGVRGDSSDILEKYRMGAFGALPDPDLFQSLLEVRESV